MKQHTTNYTNALILPAEDSKAGHSEIPQAHNGKETIATMQYEKIARHPYTYTSDDVIFGCYADKQDIPESLRSKAREEFFSKGQPCLRTSPLAKKHGFGIHSDSLGRVKLIPMESEEFGKMLEDERIQKVKAMRSSRAK
jgi:hypothetical protein